MALVRIALACVAALALAMLQSRGCGFTPDPLAGEGEPCTRSSECQSHLTCGGGVCRQPGMDDSGVPPPPDAGDRDAAGDPDAGDVDAGDVDAGDPDAGDVDAGDLDAGDLDSGPDDPDAGEFDAGDPDASASDAGGDASPP